MTKTTELPFITSPGANTSFVIVDNTITSRIKYTDLLRLASVNVQGSQGIQGSSNGNQGVQGVQGRLGPAGSQGIRGRSGDTGIQGRDGSAVAQGVQGRQGVQGLQGMQGTSIQGVQGRQGISGSAVAQGIQGINGAQGIQGSTGVVAVGANTQLIYNNNGTLAGDASLVWNNTSKILTLGANSTNGTILVQGRLSDGATTIFGTEYSSGGPVLAYAVAPSSSAVDSFVSTYKFETNAISRGAYTISGSSHKWFSTSSQDVAIGSAVTLNKSMVLETTGLTIYGNLTVTGTTSNVIPAGGIIMWSGAVSVIPSGWILCDGSNGTPDLRSKFIVGASAAGGYSVGVSGGYADAVAISHSHTYSGTTGNTDLSHTHNSQYDNRTPTGIDYTGAGSEISGMGTTYTYPTTGASVSMNHSHSFSGTTSLTGSDGTNRNLPPYYALAFIMKS